MNASRATTATLPAQTQGDAHRRTGPPAPASGPLAIAASLPDAAVRYLTGDLLTGVVTAAATAALGEGSVWLETRNGASSMSFALNVSTGKRYLRAKADGTVSLTADVSDPGTEWVVDYRAVPTDNDAVATQYNFGTEDGKWLVAAGDGSLRLSPDASAGWQWSIVPGLDVAAIGDYITRFGPIVHHHPLEQYHMCSLEWYLQHASLYDRKTGAVIPQPTFAQLPQTIDPDDGQRFSLNIDDGAKGGQQSTAKTYVHALVGFGHVDLQFWRFYAYNGPGTCYINSAGPLYSTSDTVGLAPLGEHWGDWELVVIRVDTTSGKPVGVWLAQHSSGQWFEGDALAQLQRAGEQFVFYASRNGHATYPTADAHPSEGKTYSVWPYSLHFELRNDTRSGAAFDSAAHAQIIATDLVFSAPPVPPWVQYPYRWGPVGTSSSITTEAVNRILIAALGNSGILIAGLGLGYMAAILASAFKQDDLNGPEGPITKAATWAGHYS